MDATQNDSAMLPTAYRSLAEINADMEKLREERDAAIAEMNVHRESARLSAYTIADVLERAKHFRSAEPDAELLIWFEGREGLRAVTSVHSWRGRYDEPAIGGLYDDLEPNQQRPDGSVWNQHFTVEMLIDQLQNHLVVDTYQGYKGGDYTYELNDRLLIDNHGDYSGENVIIGITRIRPTETLGADGLLLVGLDADRF